MPNASKTTKQLLKSALIMTKKRAVWLPASLILLFFLIDLAFPFRVNPRYSTLVTASDGTVPVSYTHLDVYKRQ